MSVKDNIKQSLNDITGGRIGGETEEDNIQGEEDKGRVDIDDLEGEELQDALDYLDAIGEETKRQNIEEAAYYLRNVNDDKELYSAYETGDERGRVDRSIIAPNNMERELEWHTRDGDFYQILTTTSLPRLVNPGWLIPLTLSKHDVRISMHIKPRETTSVKGRLQQRLTQMKSAIQWKKRRGRTDVYEEEHERKELERLLRNVIEGTTKLFDFAFYLEIHGETLEEMEEASRVIQRNVQEQGMDVVPIEGRQIKAQQAMAPVGTDPILNGNTVQLEALATFFNFVEPPVKMPKGVLVGFDDSKRPVIVDRFELSGHSKVVSGKIGSGKTYATKMAIYRRLLNDSDLRTVIFDPLGDDFVDFTEKLEGQVINFGGGDRINPLQIEPPNSNQKANKLYTTKVRSVLEILKTFLSQDEREGMSAAEEGVITQCIHYAYAKKGITSDPSTFDKQSPIIDDVIEGAEIVADGGLKSDECTVDITVDDLADCPSRTKNVIKEPSKEHKRISEKLLPKFESFKEGSVNNNLNGNTNIELDDRIVCFNMESFADTGEMPLIMHTMLDWAYQESRRTPMKIDVTFEEAHYLLGRSGARKLLNLFIRHARHFDAGLTLISQTPDEFLGNSEKKEIYDNCDIKQLFYQENVSEEVIEYFDFSQEEVRFLRQAARGQNSNFSECLLSTSEHGRRRLEIYAGPYEQHILDEDLDPWGFLKQQGLMTSEEENHEGGKLEDTVPTTPEEQAQLVTDDVQNRENNQRKKNADIHNPGEIESDEIKKDSVEEENENEGDADTDQRDPFEVNTGSDTNTENILPDQEQKQEPEPNTANREGENQESRTDPIDTIGQQNEDKNIDWSSVDEENLADKAEKKDEEGDRENIDRDKEVEELTEKEGTESTDGKTTEKGKISIIKSKLGSAKNKVPIIGGANSEGDQEKEDETVENVKRDKENNAEHRRKQKPESRKRDPKKTKDKGSKKDVIDEYLGSDLVQWLLKTLPVIILIFLGLTALILFI